MPVVEVRNLRNEVVGELTLSDAVFGVPLNKALIWEAVKAFGSNQRAGTVATKTRGDVSGSGRKLWKQKGTGRARVSSIRTPLWRGGGNVHGPQPRDWSVRFPKKMRRGALRSALSERIREGNVIVVENFDLGSPKTREFIGVLKNLGVDGKALIVESGENVNLSLSSRNLRLITTTNHFGINIYDVLKHEKVIFSRDAIVQAEALLSGSKNSEAAQ